MTNFLVSHLYQPKVQSDVPGRLRLVFSRLEKLPAASKQYLHYIQEAMLLLPGVITADYTPQTASLLVVYQSGQLTGKDILLWVETVVAACLAQLAYQKQHNLPLSEQALYAGVHARLTKRLQGRKPL